MKPAGKTVDLNDKSVLKSVKCEDPSGKDKPFIAGQAIEDQHSPFHWNRRNKLEWTIALFFGCVLVYSVRSSMSIAATVIGKELGWNKQISGMVLSSFFGGYVTTNILGGYLADRYGGEKVIYYTSLVWSLMTVLLPFVAKHPEIIGSRTLGVIIARFLTGVGQGMFFPSVTNIATKRTSVTDRALVFGFIMSGSAVGTITTGFFGTFIIDYIGWPWLFVILGTLGFGWCYFIRVLGHKASERDRSLVINQGAQSLFNRERFPWCKLFSKAPVWALLIVYFCNNFSFYNLLSWLPVYFHDAFPKSKGWIFNVVPWFVNFILANVSGYLANGMLSKGFSVTFVRKLYTIISLGGATLFLLLLNSIESFEQALFVMSMIVGLMAFSNCGPVQNSQDLAPRFAGALYGVMNTVGALSGIVGVSLTGHILESLSSWSAVFQIIAFACTTGCVTFILAGSGERIIK